LPRRRHVDQAEVGDQRSNAICQKPFEIQIGQGSKPENKDFGRIEMGYLLP